MTNRKPWLDHEVDPMDMGIFSVLLDRLVSPCLSACHSKEEV